VRAADAACYIVRALFAKPALGKMASEEIV